MTRISDQGGLADHQHGARQARHARLLRGGRHQRRCRARQGLWGARRTTRPRFRAWAGSRRAATRTATSSASGRPTRPPRRQRGRPRCGSAGTPASQPAWRMRVHDRQARDPGRPDLERRHGPADGPPRAGRTGHRPGHRAGIAGVLCGAHAQVLSAAELSIGRRIAGATRSGVAPRAWQERALRQRRSACAAPSATCCRTADLRSGAGARRRLALPSLVPTHPEGVRFTPGQADEVIAAIGGALAGAELTVDELTEAVAERAGPWAVERTVEAFGHKWPRWRQLHEHGRAPRDAVLRAGPGPQGHLHQPAPLAARFPPHGRRTRPCARSSRATCTRTARPRRGASPGRSASRRGSPPGCSAIWPTGWSASSWTASRTVVRRHRDARPAAPGDPPAALLRRVRRRGSSPVTAVSRRGRRPRARLRGPAFNRACTAGRRRGRWRAAPAALRPEPRHQRRAASSS